MTDGSGKKVKVVFRTDPKPPPLFANNIQTIGVSMGSSGFVTINFYSSLFEVAIDEVPDEVEARLVAQVVVPQGIFEEFIGNIVKKSPAASGEERGEEE